MVDVIGIGIGKSGSSKSGSSAGGTDEVVESDCGVSRPNMTDGKSSMKAKEEGEERRGISSSC
jgi:hypothetical protein